MTLLNWFDLLVMMIVGLWLIVWAMKTGPYCRILIWARATGKTTECIRTLALNREAWLVTAYVIQAHRLRERWPHLAHRIVALNEMWSEYGRVSNKILILDNFDHMEQPKVLRLFLANRVILAATTVRDFIDPSRDRYARLLYHILNLHKQNPKDFALHQKSAWECHFIPISYLLEREQILPPDAYAREVMAKWQK